MGDLIGKNYFITGGSGGLGKGLAKILFARGAHVTLFARNEERLAKAKKDILGLSVHEKQELNTVSLDLADGSQVEEVFRSQRRIPDEVYCSTGGAIWENGFLADIKSSDLKQAMDNNYLTAVFAAQAALRIWREADTEALQHVAETVTQKPKVRRVVFVSSAAAFIALPGYDAYTPTKYAVRAIAETLRLEAMLLSNAASTYKIHCAYPATFISPGFIDEQATKPLLTKQLEGTDMSMEEMKKRFPSGDEMARRILAGVEAGDFAVCPDFDSQLLYPAMMGGSPRRGLGISLA
ncbi:short chain dehydrogenase/ reductase [Podospora aff. communis PSN243]|uniref:Short chain dehydrogenase/ reductase n=1 Tax=Podospora aff. communis PSN243 TaxID=3040156 RepID=A0AAV9GT03_9PEZI|nr:short chain dehydrogenase/ reductase [Podospora aff. communis PSN243]